MSLRCSLVGHDWGESEIERDREENGSEVVLTVREYEVCGRCEERNLISENTEVTTLSTGDDESEGAPEPTRDGASDADAAGAVDADDAAADAAVGDDAPEADAAAAAEADAVFLDDDESGERASTPAADDSDGGEASVESDDAVFIDDAEDDRDVATAEDVIGNAEEPVDDAAPDAHADPTGGNADTEPAPESDPAPDAAEEPPASEVAAADDGVIMDDDDDDPVEDEDRDRGEWPEHEDDVAPETHESGDASAGAADQAATESASTGAEGEVTAVDDEPADDGHNAELIDDDDEGAVAEDSRGATESVPSESPSGIKSAGSTAPPGERHTRKGELVCPNCSNTESAERTSLRAGDICPECRKGYLSNPGE